MASSSEPMDDDTFKARVHKIFGSLSGSPSPALNSLWSLTDDEVEKREWNRDERNPSKDDDETLCSSSFDELFKKNRRQQRRNLIEEVKPDEDLEDLSDGDDEDDGKNNDEWDIRSSIGLDSTLDNEEEEDDYDREAVGRENTGSRLYMKSAYEGTTLDSHNVHPNSVTDSRRDPRANHLAAQLRLREDAASTKEMYNASEKLTPSDEKLCKLSSDHFNLKPILKRKGSLENAESQKTSKHVKFHPDCMDYHEEAHEEFPREYPVEDSTAVHNNSFLAENKPKVPDYVLNPSRYTRYDLDSSGDLDEESNRKACMSFLEQVKLWKQPDQLISSSEDVSNVLPRSVTFMPRPKAKEDHFNRSSNQTGSRVGIAAGEVEQIEDTLEDDDMDTDNTASDVGCQKSGRNYRNKSKTEDPV